MGLYAQKDAEINAINSKEKNFKVGHNMFSTWTHDEYKKLLGYVDREIDMEPKIFPVTDEVEVDWRTKGAVNPVKNQGKCGSCWAFSATNVMEGAHFIATGDLLTLSEQQLVSCETDCDGCGGGFSASSFKYL